MGEISRNNSVTDSKRLLLHFTSGLKKFFDSRHLYNYISKLNPIQVGGGGGHTGKNPRVFFPPVAILFPVE